MIPNLFSVDAQRDEQWHRVALGWNDYDQTLWTYIDGEFVE